MKSKKPCGYWNYKEACIKEAKKYDSIRAWQLGSPGSMNSAYRHNWMYECCMHMPGHSSKPVEDETDKAKVTLMRRLTAENNVMNFLGLRPSGL